MRISRSSLAVLALATLTGGLALTAGSAPAAACDRERTTGELCLFAGSYCPVDTMEADGRVLNVQENTTLFSILGTTYGGNGVNTFALPDLRGRAPIGQGRAPGLPDQPQGTKSGAPGDATGTVTIQPAAQGETISATAPSLAMRYCIVTNGIYPRR